MSKGAIPKLMNSLVPCVFVSVCNELESPTRHSRDDLSCASACSWAPSLLKGAVIEQSAVDLRTYSRLAPEIYLLERFTKVVANTFIHQLVLHTNR